MKSFKAADLLHSGTILRPTWFTSTDEVDYETTRKGESEKGSVISQKVWRNSLLKLLDLQKSTFGRIWE